MRLLLVEDDAAKRHAIRGYLAQRLPNAEVLESASFRETIDVLLQSPPDLVLLDMTIPSLQHQTSDRDHVLVFGGRDVLRQLRRLRIPAAVIVVTAYDRFDKGKESMSVEELHAELASVYPEFYRGIVSFSFRYESWKDELTQFLPAEDSAGDHRSSSL